jgi:hypothetical protein
MAVAVEKANSVAGAKPADGAKMVSFRSRQRHRSRLQWPIEVKPFGHPCYNTRAFARKKEKGKRKKCVMADVPSQHSPDSASSPSTRQLLEELDDLMQRMLALPVEQAEDEPAAAPQPKTAEAPKTLEKPPQKTSTASASSPRSVHLLHVPATRVTVQGPVAAQNDDTRKLPATQEVAARATPSPKQAATAHPPVRDKTPDDAVSPTYVPVGAESLLPILLQHPTKAQQKTTPPVEPSPRKEPLPPVRPTWTQALPTAPPTPRGPMKWLVEINDTFEGFTAWLGPLGRWMQGEQGRSFVGWSGLAMIVAALLWAAVLFLS